MMTFSPIAIVSSIFITVVLALERCLAVAKPIEYHNAIQGTNPWRRVVHYIGKCQLKTALSAAQKWKKNKIQHFLKCFLLLIRFSQDVEFSLLASWFAEVETKNKMNLKCIFFYIFNSPKAFGEF